jgi:putative colanic acid biosynthesis UDP-glucose lipid carrier transferase
MGRTGLLKAHHQKLLLLLRLVDGAIIALAHFVALRAYEQSWELRHAVATLLAVGLYYAFGQTTGLHRPWRQSPLRHQLGRVWVTWSLVVPGLLLVAFFGKLSEDFSRVASLLWFVIAPVAISLWRTTLRLGLQELRLRGRNTRQVAVVGVTPTAERVAREIVGTPWLGLRIRGFYDDRTSEKHAFGGPEPGSTEARLHRMPAELGPMTGTFDELVEDARNGKVDLVYVTLPLRAEGRIRQLVTKLADTTATVQVVPDLFLSDLMQSRWTSLGSMPVLSVFDTPFYGVDGWLKRVEDLVLGTIILSMISVPMLVVAAAIKLTSKGPVFFRQHRYGLNGQRISVLKFRTMTVCEDGEKIKQASKNDARITRLGAFLRRTSLDELPQFLNVLTGEMSIVGPRPHAVAHNEEYRKLIHGYMLRHKVKPGITGWAQVNGWRGETDTLEKMSKRIEHDLDYIRRWELSFDLKIILMTIFSSSTRKNAY